MPRPYPREFREDVVRATREREPGQTLKQIATDFGISESCPVNWLKAADLVEGGPPAAASAGGQSADLREAKKRIRLLGQENEFRRPAAAYLSQANPPGK